MADPKREAVEPLEQFILGDENAFADVVRTLRGPLIRLARAHLGNAEEAKDVVQEAFCRLYRKAGSIRGNARAWIFRVTRNLAIDRLRSRARRREDSIEALDADGGRSDPDPDARLNVEAALQALTARDRAVVLLKVVEGMSYREIAEIMELTVGNVGYIIHHGLKKMASRLAEGGAL